MNEPITLQQINDVSTAIHEGRTGDAHRILQGMNTRLGAYLASRPAADESAKSDVAIYRMSAERVRALQDACEGEMDGAYPDDDAAIKILTYLDSFELVEVASQENALSGQWVHCSPALIQSGVSCEKTPRRACACGLNGSHDHWIGHVQSPENVKPVIAYMHRFPGSAWELSFADDDGKLVGSHSKAYALVTADNGECVHEYTASCKNAASTASKEAVTLSYPEELTPELREVLGRMCFQCISIAQCMRADGVEIAKRAEDEQATVLHWLTNVALKHGPDWRIKAQQALNEMEDRLGQRDASKAEGKS